MIKLEQTGVGSQSNTDREIFDSTGTGLLPIQAQGDGATTFRILARVAPDANWMEIIPAQTADMIQSITWVPHLKLDVTSGAGKVTLWIGEK